MRMILNLALELDLVAVLSSSDRNFFYHRRIRVPRVLRRHSADNPATPCSMTGCDRRGNVVASYGYGHPEPHPEEPGSRR